jgi:ketosteroid isomerase-like protein
MKIAPAPKPIVQPKETAPLAAPAAAAETAPVSTGWAAKTAKTAPVAAPGAAPKSPGEVATAFYKAFTSRDLETMKSHYSPDVKFKDAMFEYGDRAGTMHMWTKLIGANEVKAEYKLDRVEGDVAYGHWVADYELNGRPVHNEITSQLTVRDGKIVEHKDDFDFKKWAAQALPLGPLVNSGAVRWLAKQVIRGFINM